MFKNSYTAPANGVYFVIVCTSEGGWTNVYVNGISILHDRVDRDGIISHLVFVTKGDVLSFHPNNIGNNYDYGDGTMPPLMFVPYK